MKKTPTPKGLAFFYACKSHISCRSELARDLLIFKSSRASSLLRRRGVVGGNISLRLVKLSLQNQQVIRHSSLFHPFCKEYFPENWLLVLFLTTYWLVSSCKRRCDGILPTSGCTMRRVLTVTQLRTRAFCAAQPRDEWPKPRG